MTTFEFRRFLLAIMVGAAVFAFAALPTVPGRAESPIESAECEFQPPDDVKAQCGYLTVPERRDDSTNSSKVRLYFAQLRSRAAQPSPYPVIYLAGGPGGNGVDYADWMDVILRNHDLILLDQRGTGYSKPSLNCIEVEQAKAARDLGAYQACRARLADEGVDLAAYNSAESAADLDDLRAALGFEQWVLYGISYGTRLALTAMRDYPDGLHSVILDGVYPPQVNAYEDQGPNGIKALDTMFADCAADSACSQAFPDLRDVFYQTLAALNAEPVTYTATDPNTGDANEVTLSGDELFDRVFQAMYDTSLIPLLPKAIYAASEGDFATFDALLADKSAGAARRDDPEEDLSDSEGMNLSVECREEVPFTDMNRVKSALSSAPEAIREKLVSDVQSIFDQCEIWDIPKSKDIENQPVTSRIPTLVLNGQYDPITPPSWGKIAADALGKAYNFTFPGVGHSAIGTSECVNSIVTAFLEAPESEPDGGCIADLTAPEFVTQ